MPNHRSETCLGSAGTARYRPAPRWLRLARGSRCWRMRDHSAEAPGSHSIDTDARSISSYGLGSSSCLGHHGEDRPASFGWTSIAPCPVQTGWRRDSSGPDPIRPGQRSAGVVRCRIHACALSDPGRSGFGAGRQPRPGPAGAVAARDTREIATIARMVRATMIAGVRDGAAVGLGAAVSLVSPTTSVMAHPAIPTNDTCRSSEFTRRRAQRRTGRGR